MHTLTHTGCTVHRINFSERNADSIVHIEAYFIHKAIAPPRVENRLHFRENCFDRIELRRICNVEDRYNLVLTVNFLYDVRLMNIQLVHKQCKFTSWISSA